MAGEIPDLQHYTSYVGIISHDQYDDGGGTDGNGWRTAVKERDREREGGRERETHGGRERNPRGCTLHLTTFSDCSRRGMEKSFIKRRYFVRQTTGALIDNAHKRV